MLVFKAIAYLLLCNLYPFYFSSVAWGSYFDYVAEWDKYIDEENIIAISYEELQEVRLCDTEVTSCFF